MPGSMQTSERHERRFETLNCKWKASAPMLARLHKLFSMVHDENPDRYYMKPRSVWLDCIHSVQINEFVVHHTLLSPRHKGTDALHKALYGILLLSLKDSPQNKTRYAIT